MWILLLWWIIIEDLLVILKCFFLRRPKEDAIPPAHIAVAHPLLAPCLNGLGKFSHLIDLDYIGDLMNYLKRLASADGKCNSTGKCLTVGERLRCCIISFKVMRSNLDALNVDLQDFFAQLYNLILEYRPEML